MAAHLPEHVRTALDASCGGALMSGSYLKFVVQELKPFIDAEFSTRPEREATFMLGSSMGGIIAIEALAVYPEVFGGAAALSAHMFLIGPGAQTEGFVLPEDTGDRVVEAATRFGAGAGRSYPRCCNRVRLLQTRRRRNVWRRWPGY